MNIILLLIGIGTVLLIAEVFIPSGILGVIGGLVFVGASVVGYNAYGMREALMIFGGAVALTIIFFLVQYKLLTKTFLGDSFLLRGSISGREHMRDKVKLGTQCVAQTDLSPTGIVSDARGQYEARSEDGFIQKGEKLTVVGHEYFCILVRKQAP